MPVPEPVQSHEQLPAHSDVVIIGGGIIGVCAALELAGRGIRTTLCEKGIIAGEQSGRNWGWVRQMGRDPCEIELIVKSRQIWAGLDRRINASTGFKQCGIVYLLDDENDISRYQAWINDHARPAGIDSRLITGAEISNLFPTLTSTWKAALYTPSDARAEPQLAAPAIARAAQRQGAQIFTRCAVRHIETAAGRISAVITEKGKISTTQVVIAAGAWSRHLCKWLGLSLPQLTTISPVMRTASMTGPGTTVAGHDFAIRKRADGGFTIAPDFLTWSELTPAHLRHLMDFMPLIKKHRRDIRLGLSGRFLDEWQRARKRPPEAISAFEETRILDPAPPDKLLERGLASLQRHLPEFSACRIVERWAGCIDVTPDEVPFIDRVEHIEGLIIATGFSGHGFGIGPGAGHLTADLVTGNTPIASPEPFRLDRFQRIKTNK